MRKARGLPDVEPDTEFLQALEQGLPQCAGVALGVDRLLMLSRRAVRLEPLVPTMDS